MTTNEMKKTLKEVIDSLESIHEKLLAYGQQPTGTDQTVFSFSLQDGEAGKEHAANGIFAER